ncbi:MAG: enoyl-CoA hydratase/isomerase family protein [Holosporaceae bacterium]|jgi:enoyl-CoA hydratase/carnithine racemase|nr:enoyl-CoA hydratase/isomerase family protein [Holosporaceae bacterium]
MKALTELSFRGSVAILTLNNPAKLNVLSSDLMAEIHRSLEGIEKKSNVLVIRGCEKAFAAGVDVSEIHALSYEKAYLNDFIDHRWESVFNVKIPVIAAVSGYALGGGFELVLMCDMVVAAPSAVFGFPEVNLGLMPGMGGTQLLTGIVGPKIASEILMTGRFVSSGEAATLGIVSHLTEESDDLLAKALDLAEKIAKKSVMSTRMIKEAVRMAQNIGLSSGLKSERQMFRSLFSTSFKQNGTEAFLKK